MQRKNLLENEIYPLHLTICFSFGKDPVRIQSLAFHIKPTYVELE